MPTGSAWTISTSENVKLNGPFFAKILSATPLTGAHPRWGALYARAGRRGWRDLQQMPEWQPGSNGRQFFSDMAYFIPILGEIKMLQEVLTGQDYVAGTHISTGRRALMGAAVLAPFLRPLASKAKELFKGGGRFFARVLAWLRGGCFVAGTPVACVAGPPKAGAVSSGGSVRYTKVNGAPWIKQKPIEQIKAGDLVLARSEKMGQTEAKRVLRTTVRRAASVLTLHLADAHTGKPVETITATANHPFYVIGQGFVETERLGIGCQIVTRAGPRLVIQSVERQSRPQGYLVYNLEVEGDHSYFVGQAHGGAWVHNGVCPGSYVLAQYSKDVHFYDISGVEVPAPR